jgi:hypothetical protein
MLELQHALGNQSVQRLIDEDERDVEEGSLTEMVGSGHDIGRSLVSTDTRNDLQPRTMVSTTENNVEQGLRAGRSTNICGPLAVGAFVKKEKGKGCNSMAEILGVAFGRYSKCNNIELMRLLIKKAQKKCNAFCKKRKCPPGTLLLPKKSIYRDTCRKENRSKECPYLEYWYIGPRWLGGTLWNCECGGFRCS